MKAKIIIALLAITLAACAQTNTADIQNTAVAIVQTGVALTQTALPTATLPPPTFTPTALPTSTPEATPIPTQPPPPIFTPDAIQVERWKEYQTELAKVVLYGYSYGPDIYKNAICEWDILGRSDQEVYVWAFCASREEVWRESPAVIHLDADGTIQKVSTNNNLILKFPTDVLEKIHLYYTPAYPNEGRPYVLKIHLNYRETHPEEPPLVVISATAITDPMP